MTPKELYSVAFDKFWNDESYKDVSDFLQANGMEKGEVVQTFNKMFDSGLGFLPGLTKWGIQSGRRAQVDKALMARYIDEQSKAEDKALLREEHPVAARLLPGFLQGRMEDASGRRAQLAKLDSAKYGEKKGLGADGSYLRETGRAISDLEAVLPRAGGAALGTAIESAGGPHFHFADMDDTEGAFNDPWIVPSMLVPMGAAGRVITGAGKLSKAGRFALDAGLDAAGSVASSRLSDKTEDVGLGQGLAGGAIGTGVGRLLGKIPQKPLSKKDALVDYATSPTGLNLKPEELPSSVLNTEGGRSVAEQLEQTLGSSPLGEEFLRRHANLNRILNQKATEVLERQVDGYTPARSAYDVIQNIRRSWGAIEREAFKDHFNFSNKFKGSLADALVEQEDKSFAKLAEDLIDEDAIARKLEQLTAPNNTLGALDDRIAYLEKRIESLHGAKQLESPYYKELDLLYTLKDETLKGRDILPTQRLRQLDEVRKSLQDFLDVNKNEALPSKQKKFAEELKRLVKRDQEEILRSGWFGEAGEAAFPVWKESATKAEKFLAGKAELAKFLNPRKANERGLENVLTDGTEYFAKTVREALELGGEEGKRRLADLRRLALSEALANEAKEGVPWTTSLRNYRKAAPGLDALMGADDPVRNEMLKIIGIGSRAGAATEAGSAFAKNSSLLNPSLWMKRLKYIPARNSQLKALGLNSGSVGAREFGEAGARSTSSKIGREGVKALMSKSGRAIGKTAASKVPQAASSKEEDPFEKWYREQWEKTSVGKPKSGLVVE